MGIIMLVIGSAQSVTWSQIYAMMSKGEMGDNGREYYMPFKTFLWDPLRPKYIQEEEYAPMATPSLAKWSMCLADWLDLL